MSHRFEQAAGAGHAGLCRDATWSAEARCEASKSLTSRRTCSLKVMPDCASNGSRYCLTCRAIAGSDPGNGPSRSRASKRIPLQSRPNSTHGPNSRKWLVISAGGPWENHTGRDLHAPPDNCRMNRCVTPTTSSIPWRPTAQPSATRSDLKMTTSLIASRDSSIASLCSDR